MKKPVFSTPEEAFAALKADRLGSVYRQKGRVFVITAFGSAEFSSEEWERVSGKPKPDFRVLKGVEA